MDFSNFVDRVDFLLKIKNRKRQDLAKECGFTVQNMSKWKYGQTTPAAEYVYAIAQYLGVTMEWLLTGNDPENLSDTEHSLIQMYRGADDRGKINIFDTATKEFARQLERK